VTAYFLAKSCFSPHLPASPANDSTTQRLGFKAESYRIVSCFLCVVSLYGANVATQMDDAEDSVEDSVDVTVGGRHREKTT
jgi:hypothetical protein